MAGSEFQQLASTDLLHQSSLAEVCIPYPGLVFDKQQYDAFERAIVYKTNPSQTMTIRCGADGEWMGAVPTGGMPLI